MTLVSIVVPLYKSAGSVDELVRRLDDLAIQLAPDRLQVVFVDDGSPDDVAERLEAKLPLRCEVLLLRHSRNFGAFAAVRTGMDAATGDFIGVMAADLQEPPELLPQMIAELERSGRDVAYGRRVGRSGDPWSSRVASALYWRFYRRFVQPEMPAGGVDIFLCRSHVARAVCAMKEANSSLIGALVWLGFPSVSVPYERGSRVGGGRSSWSLRRRLRYMTDSAFSFSRLPLTVLGATGGLGLIVCSSVGVVVVVARLTHRFDVPGYTALMLTILFCTSLLLVALWVVGEMAWRTFDNTKERPLAVVRSEHGWLSRVDPTDDSGAGQL